MVNAECMFHWSLRKAFVLAYLSFLVSDSAHAETVVAPQALAEVAAALVEGRKRRPLGEEEL